MKLNQGDRVYWDVKKTNIPVGRGTICGVATIPQVINGRQMIVRLDDIVSEEYPYDTLVIWENWLSVSMRVKGWQ